MIKSTRRLGMIAIGKRLSMVLCVGLAVIALGGCEREGPAERAGKEIDKTTEKLGDALEKDGPMERAGEQIDKAVEKAGDELEKATER
jgi:hypothetical protein